MNKLLIISHTPSENTKAMTRAVIDGANHPDLDEIELKVLPPLQAGSEDVLWADGVILGTTENFGYMSGAMKDFFDRAYYPCLEKTEGLPYVLFIRAGNDGQGARSSIERIVTGLSWKQVQAPLICTGAWDDKFIVQCKELGATMVAGLEAGVF